MRELKIFFLMLSVLMPRISAAQEADSVMTLLFAGDIMCHETQLSSARDDSTGGWLFDTVFSYISPVISDADFAIGNLEVTLGGPPYTGYPAFSAPDSLAAACINAGFDVLATANNHSADRGSKGVSRTVRVLDSLAVLHTGTWISNQARDTLTPLILSRNGITAALLNYTYGTNGITVAPPPVVSYIDTLRIYEDISAARKNNADITIVFIHWGNEYDSLPSLFQKRTAMSIFRAGADIIIGSHPHVIQPMTMISDSTGVNHPVVWSMGNFVSNQRRRGTDGGAMIKFELRKTNGELSIGLASYILTWVYRPIVKGKREFYIIPCSAYEDNPGFFQSASDYTAMKLFTSDARRLLYSFNHGFRELVSVGDMWIEVSH
jgi:poly-gamma-glutamate synthesis protein (capsule biosynthesis protein)